MTLRARMGAFMRFIPHTDAEVAQMLAAVGAKDVSELFADIPAEFQQRSDLDLGAAMDEAALIREFESLASRNATTQSVTSFVGAGAYDHFVPAAVRALATRAEFVTAYTPYQPELSQGTLQAQFEFQTLVARLLGLDVANASMYEGATALAEACLMARRQTRRARVIVSRAVHPEYRAVLRTYVGAEHLVEAPFAADGATDASAIEGLVTTDAAAVVIQSPNFFGVVEDLAAFAKVAHDREALLVATFTEPLAFGLCEPPGALGADVAAGEGQSFGLPLSFGGPYVGLFAVRKALVKGMPGRLVGRTVDARGTPCYTLTLAAREQHIRRARASSNICTNEGLCALTVAVYLSLLGRTGLKRLALFNHLRAEALKARLSRVPGVSIAFLGATFNEFVVRLGRPAAAVAEALARGGLVPGLPLGAHYPELDDALLVTVTETRTDADFDRLIAGVSGS